MRLYGACEQLVWNLAALAMEWMFVCTTVSNCLSTRHHLVRVIHAYSRAIFYFGSSGFTTLHLHFYTTDGEDPEL